MQTANSRSGLPPNIFCNKVKSEAYHCLICLEVSRSPVTCRSGAHLFCLDCLTESLRRNPTCPTCREPLTAPLPSAFASAQVSALDVVCVHDECNWKGTCGRLDSHLDTNCVYEPIPCSGEGGCGELVPRGEMATHKNFSCLRKCPNSKSKVDGSDNDEQDTCDVRLNRHDLVEHLQHHCKLRPTRCPHQTCEVSLAYNRMAAHIEVCPHAPVSCPLECGAPDLTRAGLEAHKSDCLNEHVSCVHAPLGCSYVAPRGQIGKHEQNVGLHFVALSKAFVQLQQSYEKKVGEMEDKLHKKVGEIEMLRAQVASFAEELQQININKEAKAEAKAKADDIIQKVTCDKCNKNPATSFYEWLCGCVDGTDETFLCGRCNKCGPPASSRLVGHSKADIVESILRNKVAYYRADF